MKRKITISILISFVVLILAFGIYCFIGIYNYMMSADGQVYQNMSDKDREEYCSMALLPDLKDRCKRYNLRIFSNPRDGKYRRITVECCSCDDLPEAYQEPIQVALDSGKCFDSTDFDHVHVDAYYIEGDLPLAEIDDLPQEYRELANSVSARYYQVWEYEDGTRIFVFWFDYKK